MSENIQNRNEIILAGTPASPGIVIAPAFIIHDELHVPRYSLAEWTVESEIKRFTIATEQAKAKLGEIYVQLANNAYQDNANIFQAHLMILDDRVFIDRIRHEVESKLINAEAAILDVGEEFIKVFSQSDDIYLREKAADLRDIIRHLISNLSGREQLDLSMLEGEVIVVAHDLTPSDTVLLRKDKIAAFATDVGSRISHTAILARSLNIPAVVGLGNITAKLKTGDLIILDGTHGKVTLHPGEETIRNYKVEQEKFYAFEESLHRLTDLPVITLDGHKRKLSANIEFPDEIYSVKIHGGKGIGLYRTEYFYVGKDDLPSEDELFEDYKEVAQQIAPEPVIIRTLDLGGDKFASYLGIPHTVSSIMGLRAIRLCLKYQDIFLPQLRAILRASIHGNIKIMFPMISGVEELRQAKEVLDTTKRQLTDDGVPFDHNMEVGAMIEIPSAAMTADILAKEVDFFSIGTNDLIQYSLAVDRANEEISELFEPFHPAVLRFIRHVINAAHENGIWVGLCGEMAGDPVFTILLLGMGLDEFSMSPQVIPEIKRIIRSVTLKEAQELAKEIMTLSTAWEIEQRVYEEAQKRFPELLAWGQ
ncbi:MAG: phosphoenolpyruvate--protein phosphotransferase [Candidatus Poribacteria bacterium]